MVRRIGIPRDVRVGRLAALERHLARAPHARAAPAVSPWWSGLVDAQEIDVLDASSPDRFGGLVLVDQLREQQNRAFAAVLALEPEDRIVFSEVDRIEGPRLTGALADFDATGTLWANGISVIDVDREPIRTDAGVWHIVTGVARRTPR